MLVQTLFSASRTLTLRDLLKQCASTPRGERAAEEIAAELNWQGFIGIIPKQTRAASVTTTISAYWVCLVHYTNSLKAEGPAKSPPIAIWSDDIQKNRQLSLPVIWKGCYHPHDLLLPMWFVPVYLNRPWCRWEDRAECPESFSSVPALHGEGQQELLPRTADSFHWLLSAAPLHLPDYIFKTTSCVSNLKLQMAENRCTDLKQHPKCFKNTKKKKINTWTDKNIQQRAEIVIVTSINPGLFLHPKAPLKFPLY